MFILIYTYVSSQSRKSVIRITLVKMKKSKDYFIHVNTVVGRTHFNCFSNQVYGYLNKPSFIKNFLPLNLNKTKSV